MPNFPPIVALAVGLAAGAEDPTVVEEITVTADLRSDRLLREVPTSLTILDRQVLERSGEQHFQEVIDQIPNLNWSAATSRPRFFQIRGIGELSQYEGAPNPSVGFVIDDIDFSGIGMAATLFDTERVEVLRGPQGTRYGANALAGLVYVRTAEPSPTPEFRLQGLLADDGVWGAGFSASGPLNDGRQSAYRVSLHQYQGNGFRHNDYLDSDHSNQRDELAARAKLRWFAGDSLQLDFTALYADIDNGFDVFAPENTFVVHSDKPGRDAQQSLGLALRASWNGWDRAQLVGITTLADTDSVYSFDGDWGNEVYWGEFSPYDFTSETRRERTTWSQELRFVSEPDAALFGGKGDWLLGAYVLRLREENRIQDLFNGDLFRDLKSDYEAFSAALFGQLDFHLNEATKLTLGLRVERRDAEYSDSQDLSLDPGDTMAGGQVALTRELGPGRSGYLSVSRGYKAGGFNLGLSVPEPRREFAPEYLWNLEAGLKGSFRDSRLLANLAVFYARRGDVQVETSFQVDPTDPLTFVFFTDNAADGENLGLEADLRYRPTDAWELFGSLGLLKTRFKDFVTPERDLSGRAQAHAPGYQFTAGGEYRFARGWFAGAELSGRDEFLFSASHDQVSRPFELLNLKFGYRSRRWAAYAWGRNVLDREYATRGFFFGLEPPDFPDRLYLQQGDPRHLGITVRWQL